jgi:hypothetical protein
MIWDKNNQNNNFLCARILVKLFLVLIDLDLKNLLLDTESFSVQVCKVDLTLIVQRIDVCLHQRRTNQLENKGEEKV